MTRCGVCVAVVFAAACEIGERPRSYVLPGPAGPSPVATLSPYAWDSREELAIWMNNDVARGTLTLEGTGEGAFIRIERADRPWLLRGPDFSPAAAAVQTLRIRYRWTPDHTLPESAVRTACLTVNFETTVPIHDWDPTAQAAAHVDLQPRSDWTEIAFTPGQYRPPIEVKYGYVHSQGANRGVLEIDRIELAR